MTGSRIRFSILHLFELTAILGLALAAGKFAGTCSQLTLAPPVELRLVYLCAILGAYLGFRWLRRDPLAWYDFETFAISLVTTAAGVIAFETCDHRPLGQLGFASRRLTFLLLVGGILGGCLVLYGVLLGKLFKKPLSS